jgi:cell wall-associated NlpC family hydrolase
LLPVGSGVDALGIGDFNADRYADIAVASHQGGHYLVTIYSGAGQNATTSTGYAPMPLATITDPLGPGVGPLDVAVGDFTGDGVSDLAISSTGTGRAGSSKVAVYSFQLANSTPINSPVTPVLLVRPFVPPGLGRSNGIDLTAADTTGAGNAQLIAAPAHAGPKRITILSFSPQSQSWQPVNTINKVPLAPGGMNLDSGQIAGDGSTEIVAGSQVNGKVAVYDTALGQWVRIVTPLGKVQGGVRVAAVPAVGTSGAVVVTKASNKGKPKAAILPWYASTAVPFLPVALPGAGALVPLGGGYVYQRSTIQNASSSFPYSNGPVTPTVLLGSTKGSQLIVQGFTPANTPSAPDTYTEPLWGPVGNGFTPLQPRSDPAVTGGSSNASSLSSIPSNLVIYPQQLKYTSPYSINLSGAPASALAGLYPFSPIQASATTPWGPAQVPNTPPTLPQSNVTAWLQQRLLAAYASAIGVDYQHHYVANWLPEQGSPWNLTSTVAYQSEGIDCTNFTAWAYADALGIRMTGDTGQQALISPTNPNGTVIPNSLKGAVSISTITSWSSYANLVSQLQPGDILYIHGNPTDKTQVTHAITWLGIYGVDKNNQGLPLVIDSTGITPAHVNSNNQVIPEGVEIRPFGPPGSVNDWYYDNLDHVLRFINVAPASA